MPREILRRFLLGEFEKVVSYDLLLELETVLLRDKFRKKLTVSDVLAYVEYLRERATLVPSREVERSPGASTVPDPDDEYLVHLAEDARADRVVTGDKDFRGLLLADTPREFLAALVGAQQQRLLTQISEFYGVYFSELRDRLEQPDVFAEAVPDHMRGRKRVVAVGGRDGLLVVHTPIEQEIVFTVEASGKTLAHFPAEPNAEDDRYKFVTFPGESVGVLANFIGGGEEIDLDIPSDALWGVKGFSAPQQRVDAESGELAWTAPWTRLVAVDPYHFGYFEDLQRAKAEAIEDVEPYVRRDKPS